METSARKIRGSRILLQELIQQTIRQELRQVPAMRKKDVLRSPINSMVVSMHRTGQPIPKEVQRSHCKKAKRARYLFAGWYRDAKFKNAVTNLSNLTQNITVYAKWKKVTVSKVSLKKAKKSGKKKCKLTWKKCKRI